MTGLFRRRPSGMYDDDLVYPGFPGYDVPDEPSSLAELPSVIEHERLAVISTALRLAEDKDRLAEELEVVTGERDSARAVIEEVRKVFRASSYFVGSPVEDVIAAADLLATAYEAEMSRPW